MSEDRYTRNEIIADDLDDRASRNTNDIRRRINREVVRVDAEEHEDVIVDEYDEEEIFDEDLYIDEPEAESEESSEPKRPKRLIDHIITGSDRKSTRLNSSHDRQSRMPSSAWIGRAHV